MSNIRVNIRIRYSVFEYSVFGVSNIRFNRIYEYSVDRIFGSTEYTNIRLTEYSALPNIRIFGRPNIFGLPNISVFGNIWYSVFNIRYSVYRVFGYRIYLVDRISGYSVNRISNIRLPNITEYRIIPNIRIPNITEYRSLPNI